MDQGQERIVFLEAGRASEAEGAQGEVCEEEGAPGEPCGAGTATRGRSALASPFSRLPFG